MARHQPILLSSREVVVPAGENGLVGVGQVDPDVVGSAGDVCVKGDVLIRVALAVGGGAYGCKRAYGIACSGTTPLDGRNPMTVLSQAGEHTDAFKVRFDPGTHSWRLVMPERDEVGAPVEVLRDGALVAGQGSSANGGTCARSPR
jgi:hypothetical protein